MSGTGSPFPPERFIALFGDPEVRANPYPFYAELRQTEPVHRTLLDVWAVTGYEEATTILRDPTLSNDERTSTTYGGLTEGGAFSELFYKLLISLDPPDHTRLRGLVQQAFTRRVVEGLRPRIREVSDGLLSSLCDRDEVDLLADFAYPLTVQVICELLGVPVADRARFDGWARDLAARLEIQPMLTPEVEKRGDEATVAFRTYFLELLDERRRAPNDDLLSALIAAEEAGDRLDSEELLAICILLLIAGHETTSNLLGNGVLALLRHPGEFARLREEPSLVRPAVEELLRYDTPVQAAQRIASRDIDVGGTRIGAGDAIMLLLGAINRDGRRFADPDRLDVGRQDNMHLAFAAGHHFCLGAPLARTEAQVGLEALAHDIDLELADEPVWRQSFVLRGLCSLPVKMRRRARIG